MELHDQRRTRCRRPADGKERALANLWVYRGKAPQNGKPVKAVVESFGF